MTGCVALIPTTRRSIEEIHPDCVTIALSGCAGVVVMTVPRWRHDRQTSTEPPRLTPRGEIAPTPSRRWQELLLEMLSTTPPTDHRLFVPADSNRLV